MKLLALLVVALALLVGAARGADDDALSARGWEEAAKEVVNILEKLFGSPQASPQPNNVTPNNVTLINNNAISIDSFKSNSSSSSSSIAAASSTSIGARDHQQSMERVCAAKHRCDRVTVVSSKQSSCYISASCQDGRAAFEFITIPNEPQQCADYFRCLHQSASLQMCHKRACRSAEDWRKCQSKPSLGDVCEP